MHLTATLDLFLADDRYVVLRLASEHAGVPADARVGIDGHGPLMFLWIERRRIVKLGEKRQSVMLVAALFLLEFARQVQVSFEFVERANADQFSIADLCFARR